MNKDEIVGFVMICMMIIVPGSFIYFSGVDAGGDEGFEIGTEKQGYIDRFVYKFIGCGIRPSESLNHYTLECQDGNFTRKLFYADGKYIFDVEKGDLVNLTLNDLLLGKYEAASPFIKTVVADGAG